ncbi:hypothetical protein [Arthrobacter sp. Leaf137]|uniref:hypothetical protein n=1 Tax=Arthrobacter sp. Leaf137 TaxID=1736271 RepID=UPI0006FD6D41|nr:hypothetical protein [Arthrobacter sp. Leaf137]KQQ89696.1 hypothetical protein ASF64_17055 [Arthrobacter sp. Leaf137]
MTAVAEPQSRNRNHLADVVALPLPDSYGFNADPVEASDAPPEAGGWMKAVALASAKLEQLQWELDAAEEDLCAALRGASAFSVSAPALARTAGLTTDELEAYLQRPALMDVAAVPGLAGPAMPPLGMQAQA